MAVPEQTPYIEHTGNGVTTSFSLGFQCESKDHLIVLVDEIEPPIATWNLVDGNVVFTTAPVAGKKITLQRNTPFGRTANYQSFNNSFRPQTVNVDFDRIWWKLQELGVADWILGARIDALKNYVDRKDDELKAYLMEEIRKQGVALDQLDEYYNYLMQRLAEIAVQGGWEASFVVDARGKNQQEINNLNIVLDSIADMLAISNPKNGERYVIKHFDKPSGRLKGGGVFIYDSSRALENDGGVCIYGRVRQLENNVLNPFMFGAYGDFIPKAQEVIERQSGHDDSVAFQKMYNMNKYTVFTNISKLPPQNMAEYTFEWGNQMFYLEDTLPVRSYQFTDCKGGKIFFNPIGNKDLFTTPRQEMIDAYAKNTGWNTQTICFVTFKDGVILGNIGRASVVHAQKCFDGANAYKWVLDNMLIERFAKGVHIYPLDTSAWTGERIGNFYENELRNVTINECITGFHNQGNATHCSNLTIAGGYVVGHQFTNKFDYMLINVGAGFSCTGFNIAPANRQGSKALILDGCLGSSYSGGYTEWFDTFFELFIQDRFGGFSFVGSHVFKEYRDLLVRVSDDVFSKLNYADYTRTYKEKPKNNQYLNSSGIVIGGKTALLQNFFKYVPQYDFKYGLYGVQASDGLTIDVKRAESAWTGFTSKYGIRVLNFSTSSKVLKFPISNKNISAQVCILYRNIAGFSSDSIKLNVLEFNGTNDRITIGEDVIDYGNGWRLAVVKNLSEVVTSGYLEIEIDGGVQFELEHIGAYSADGYPFMPIYVDYEPSVNTDYDRLYDNNASGAFLLEGDITAPFLSVVNGAVHPRSRKARVCTISGLTYPDISQTTDTVVTTAADTILLAMSNDQPISNVGIGCVLNLQQAGVRGNYRVVGRNFGGGLFSKNIKVSKELTTGESLTTGVVLFFGSYNIRSATSVDI